MERRGMTKMQSYPIMSKIRSGSRDLSDDLDLLDEAYCTLSKQNYFAVLKVIFISRRLARALWNLWVRHK